MTAGQYVHADRRVIADLVGRIATLRDTLPPDRNSMRRIDLTNLSERQLDLIEESLKGTLTAMTLRGWGWFR